LIDCINAAAEAGNFFDAEPETNNHFMEKKIRRYSEGADNMSKRGNA